jgi:hypothetical protein
VHRKGTARLLLQNVTKHAFGRLWFAIGPLRERTGYRDDVRIAKQIKLIHRHCE